MRILDLFCGAGGAAVGYRRAGFEVVGVDIRDQSNYPYEFVHADAIAFLREEYDFQERGSDLLLRDFDAIHASPPCQLFSPLRTAAGDGHVDLLTPTRALLAEIGMPYVIENVPSAPMRADVVLCGSMFGLGCYDVDGLWRELRRHRWFETSFEVPQPECDHRYLSVGVYGNGPHHRSNDPERGGYQATRDERRAAMGINWANRDEIAQAVPPVYTEYVGKHLLLSL